MRYCFAVLIFALSVFFAFVAHQTRAEVSASGKIKVLIVDGQNNHDWRSTTPVLKAELESSGLFSVDVATSPATNFESFKPDFAAYKVVVSNYNGADWPKATQTAFEDYVKNGGGFVSVHAADNSFPHWLEYNNMIGVGGWGGRNDSSGPMIRWRDGKQVKDEKGGHGTHGQFFSFVVTTRNPEHPIMKGLPTGWLHARDELYSTLCGPAENVTVLATAQSDTTHENEPMLMTIAYGSGRVFHTTLGHNVESMRDVGFATILNRGVEWAATGNVTQKVPANFPTADKVSEWQETPLKEFPVLSPEEEAKTFQLPPGYHMECVVSDPVIKEPVVCVFDGNGRMYVAEMRTYMQDIDATGEMNPVSRVSMHESTQGNEVYDKHTVFADGLVAPREVLPLGDRVLINETNTSDIYAYYDTNHSGVSDRKELFYKGGPRGGNIEHQPSGLIWALDNWIYQAVSDLRLRYTGGVLQQGHTAPNGGQWGLNQDDYGKTWVTNAGGELGPTRYQTPIIYGGFDLAGDRSKDFQEVWPLVGLADVQGGPGRFRSEDKTLNHTTSSAGITVFRGDRLPADMKGDVFFDEPVGRLIRRAKVENKAGLTYLRNAYDKSEFLRSTDPNFRPVNITNGPDGCLYIVDMYRGIIQQATWVNKGSYLRPVVQKYGMENIFGHGRIWRLVYDGMKPGPMPHMLDETPAQLVTHLDHPNGWWRDEAQKLLVLRGDKSVVPALVEMARSDKFPLARIHALWTLEGLGTLDASLVREKLKDSAPQVRIAAIRVGESLVQKGDTSLNSDLKGMAKDSDPNVVLQALLTGKLLNWPDYDPLARWTLAATPAAGVKEIGSRLLAPRHDLDERHFNASQLSRLRKGQAIYQELCYACHGVDGAGMPASGGAVGATQAPPLAGARDVLEHRVAIVRILLNGLGGPVGGKQYPAQMVPMDTNADTWIANVTSYVRNSFGNHGAMVSPADVAKLRPLAKQRGKPWTLEELRGTYSRPLTNQSQWKLTANPNSAAAHLCADGDPATRWSSNANLAPGMWVQVELPEKTLIGGVSMDSIASIDDYAREYKIELSDDGATWGTPVASGQGTPGVMEISFPPASAKFVRITQTGTLAPDADKYWSIHEMKLFGPSGASILPNAAPAEDDLAALIGKAVFAEPGDGTRYYERTANRDFARHNFTVEATVLIHSGLQGDGSAFIGMGKGVADSANYNEPSVFPSVYLRMFPNDFAGGMISAMTNAHEAGRGSSTIGDGKHRVRMIWDAASKRATFEVAKSWDGKHFHADSTVAVDASAIDFGSEGRIFIGGANGVAFSDLSIKTLTDVH